MSFRMDYLVTLLFDCIEHFEDIKLTTAIDPKRDIPFLQYHVYKYVIAIDHFRNQLLYF